MSRFHMRLLGFLLKIKLLSDLISVYLHDATLYYCDLKLKDLVQACHEELAIFTWRAAHHNCTFSQRDRRLKH